MESLGYRSQIALTTEGGTGDKIACPTYTELRRQRLLAAISVVHQVAIGIALGIRAALIAIRGVSGLKPTDPVTMIASAVLMIAVATAAAFLPARRAARVDPMGALRYD
jgi:ABC-type antimicrobial peptide transport system permease subunit